MDFYATAGFLWVSFSTAIGTAAAIFCAGIGAQSLYRTYRAGSEKAELRRYVK